MKPNLLFIYTDEQAFNTLETYGNSHIAMPNLNRFARSATTFDQAYVTQPVCTPSRASLLTGLHPHTNGCTRNNLILNPEIPCFPEMLGDNDYVTAHFGKWHLGDELFPQHGFKEWITIEDEYNGWFSPGKDRNLRSDYHRFLVETGFAPKNGSQFGRDEAARLPECFGKPAFLAQQASRFLRENRSHPFVLYVNFLEPHMPFFGPRDGQYDPSAMPLPPNFDAVPGAEQPLKTRLLREHYARNGHSGLALADADDWRRMIANYWGLCSLVDTHVGTILDALETNGLDGNTIVVFTSDHGDMMGAHRLLAKCVMYQEAVRVPLLVRLPGQSRGRRVMGPVSQIDVVPTLLDLMGRPTPETLQGKSLRPWIENPDRACADSVFIEWNGPNCGMSGALRDASRMDAFGTSAEIEAAITDPVRSVITAAGLKLNCSPLGEHELYNLRSDPLETRNLFGECRTEARALQNELARWQERTGDTVELPGV